MTRLGLTQRVVEVPDYGERRDCLDQAWTPLLTALGFDPVPLPNQIEAVAKYLGELDLDGLLLTSGNDLTSVDSPSNPAPERDRFEMAALEYAIDTDLPVLGVCRGLELLNDYFDGDLVSVDGHVATEHALEFDGDISFTTGDTTTVNSYHDFAIDPDDLADELTPLAYAGDGTVECVTHDDLPLVGIMWHPERDPPVTDLDRAILTHVFGGSNR